MHDFPILQKLHRNFKLSYIVESKYRENILKMTLF